MRTQDAYQKVKYMKKDIHPILVTCSVTCACGNTFETKSEKEKTNTENVLWNNPHG